MVRDAPSETDRRSYIKSLVAGVGAVGLAGCSGQGDGSGDSGGDGGSGGSGDSGGSGGSGGNGDGYRAQITMGAGALSLDPHNHTSAETYSTLAAVYEPLTHITHDGQVIGRLAHNWERTDDATMRFDIEEGVSFHNGDTLTPEDVAYSIIRVGDNDVGPASPQQDVAANVVSAEPADEGHAVFVETDGPDPIIHMKYAGGSAPWIVNKSWTEERTLDELAQEANGTGPYQVTGFESDRFTDLELFEDYWGWSYLSDNDLPQVTEARYEGASEASTRVSKLLSGESQFVSGIAPADYERVNNSGNARIKPAITDRYEYIKMKCTVEPFDSLEFRQAMNLAVDTETIAQELWNGQVEVTGQPTPPGWFGYNPDVEPWPYDPDQAESLVEESGYGGAELTLHTSVGHRPLDLEASTAVANYIDQLPNVSCEIRERNFADMFEQQRGDIEDMIPFDRGTTGGSPADALAGKMQRMFHKDGSGSQCIDEDVSAMIDEASATLDMDKRERMSKELNQIIRDKAFDISLWFRTKGYGLSNDIDYEPYIDEDIHVEEFTLQN